MNTQDGSQANTDPSVSELEQRAEQHRASLDHSLNDLERTFSPEHLVEQSLDYFRDHGSDMAQSLSRSIKDNPIPLLLTGVGIAWMMASQTSSGSRSAYTNRHERYRPDYEPHHFEAHSSRGYGDSASSPRINPPVNDRGLSPQTHRPDGQELNPSGSDDHSVADKAREAISQWSDSAEQSRRRWAQKVDELRQQSGESVEAWQARAQSSLADMQDAAYRAGRQVQYRSQDAGQWMRDQPLVAGALGVAAGALMGALMPATRIEDEVLGSQSDKLKGEALRQTSGLVDKASSVAESTVERVKSKADEAIERASDKTSTAPDDEASAASRTDSEYTTTA